jgi:flagellar protein FliS
MEPGVMHALRAAQAYSQVGLETGVAAANPHRLILMLYDGALRAIGDAASYLAAGRISDKGLAISKAISIIDEGLKASLDRSQGGAITEHLYELYDYMNRRLLLASLRNDRSGFDEVSSLLTELRAAWAAIGESGAMAPAVAPGARLAAA